jgi:hypothetical protein
MLGLSNGLRQRPAKQFALLACALLLGSCGGGGSGSGGSGGGGSGGGGQPTPITITTTSLPTGLQGQSYSATLAASGGTAPLSWTLTAGTLPTGLTLTAASGAISGTPNTSANAMPLTFLVTDSSATAQTKSVTLKLTITPSNISVSVTPTQAGVTLAQPLSLTATTNDFAGVSWTASPAGGTFSSPTSASGTPVTFTVPATAAAGVYTITASSVTDASQKASATAGVTDLAGVYTYHNDLGRDGVNASEYALTSANVNTATFGKLFSCTVDGAVYAQPLWVANLSIGGRRHNVVFVATEHDSLFAFDADANPCTPLWQVSLIDAAHGGTAGEVTVPDGTSGYAVGTGYGDIAPEVGVTGTPVIDPVSNTLYVVSKSMITGTTPATSTYFQRLHAINIVTGSEVGTSPINIAATFNNSQGTPIAFNLRQENQRAGLTLVSGTVYVAWAAHEDSDPWYGWLMGYTFDGMAFSQTSVFNTAPDTSRGGIWMSNGAPAADVNGHLYVITGNGPFDASGTSAPTDDYGDSFLQLSGALAVTSWFAPSDEATDATGDKDFGAGGAAVVLNLDSSANPLGLNHLVVGGGKDGVLYLLNGDAMGGVGVPGGMGDTLALQNFTVDSHNMIFATSAFWNNTLYISTVGGPLQAFSFNPTADRFTTTAASASATTFGFPGATPSISVAAGGSAAIVWALDDHTYCIPNRTTVKPCGPAVLHAFAAGNLATELWNNTLAAGDAAGNAVKFTVPTVANGKVYIGTRGNNTGGVYGSTSVSGELDVYGLKP